MPYSTKYKSKYKNKYSKKNYSQNRQQRLSVNTVKKIARREAKNELQEELENKFSVQQIYTDLGDPDSLTTGRIITKRGLSNPATGAKDPLLFHPYTFKLQSVGHPTHVVSSGPRRRVGNEIMLKGIAIKGWLIQKSGCPPCSVRFSVMRADQHFSDLYDKQTPLDRMYIPRQLETGAFKLYSVISKEYNLSANSSVEQQRQIPINLYKKMDEKIEYNSVLIDEQDCQQGDFKKNRYILSVISDIPFISAVPPEVHTDHDYPQFYGTFICYYTDG